MYEIDSTKVIGSGQFGIIYESTNLINKKKVCAKVITSYYFQQSLQNELDIMDYLKKQKHPNIVSVLDVDQVEEDSKINTIIYMEYCKDGNLQQELDKNFAMFNLDYVLEIMRQITIGINFLHGNLIIHRDLKPANILLDQGVFKITDFGTSRFVEDIEFILKSRTGSPAYASPQILKYQEYSSKTDIYSLGIIFYQLLFNQFPFGDKISYYSIQDFHQRIKSKPFQCPEIKMNGNIYDKQKLRELINQMIQYEESDRIDLRTIFKDEDPINSNYNLDDKQLMKLDDLDMLQTDDSIHYNFEVDESQIKQLANHNQWRIHDHQKDQNQNDQMAQINLSLLNSKVINPNDDDHSQIILIESHIQQTSNNYDNVFINKHTKQGLEFSIDSNLQSLTKSKKITHVIQFFLEKCKIAQEITQIIKNLDIKEFNQLQIRGLIVALDGYSINLLQTARGFAFDEKELLQSIFRVYYQTNIKIAIKEFQENQTPQTEELRKHLLKYIDTIYRKFCFDYGQFMQLSDQSDEMNGLKKLSSQDSPNTGINAAYSIYMKWINYIYSILPLQKEAKIKIVNDPKYILQKNLECVLELENKYNLVNLYKQIPDSIKDRK